MATKQERSDGLAQRADPLACAFHCRMLASVPGPVLLLDGDRRVIFANGPALELQGRALRDVVGSSVDEFLPALGPMIMDAQCASDETSRFSVRSQLSNGDDAIFDVSVRCMTSPERDEQPVDRYVVSLTDVTTWHRMREERNRLLQLGAVTDVMPSILHELKNPLATISTALQVTLEDLPVGELRTQLAAVVSETRRMGLAFDGIGLAGRQLRTTRANTVDGGLSAAHKILERVAGSRSIELTLTMLPLPSVPFDPAVLRAILFNLVTNAIHACKEGDKVKVSAEVDSTEFRLVVDDSGCGMTPDTLDQCRRLFFTTKSNGSGIGLALIHEAVTEGGGQVDIESKSGLGTWVEIRLPLHPNAEAAR